MQFNIRTGNYSTAGKAAADDTVRAFAAARRNAPDYGKMAQQAQAIRSKVKKEGIKAATAVTKTGIQAAGELKALEITESAERKRDSARRKAGALATAGKLFGTAGSYLGEKRTKREVGGEDSFYDTMIRRNDDRLTELQAELDGLKPPSSSGSTSTPGSSTNTPSQPSGGSASGNSNGSTPISSFQASGRKGKWTVGDMTKIAEQAGFSPENARVMGAIGMAESGGNPTIDTVQSGLDPGKKGEYSIGLFQVNAQAHGDKLRKLGYTEDDLRDPVKAAQVAKMVYDEVGSFKPWSVYKSGAYSQYLQ